MGCNEQDWAVFWCSLLSPVLLGEIPERRREPYFQQLSREERRLPNGQRRRISVRTFRRQWRKLKDQGVPGLYRRRRSDRGKPRKKYADLLVRAVELKKEQPRRSDKVINRILKREFGRTVPRSTLYRHLRREGARDGSWAYPERKSAAAGRETNPELSGSATSSTDRWSSTRAGRSRHISLPGSIATVVTSSKLVITSARIWTSSSILCFGPGESMAPAASCTWTTPKSTSPSLCNWLAPS